MHSVLMYSLFTQCQAIIPCVGLWRAVVVSQLVKWSLPTPQICFQTQLMLELGVTPSMSLEAHQLRFKPPNSFTLLVDQNYCVQTQVDRSDVGKRSSRGCSRISKTDCCNQSLSSACNSSWRRYTMAYASKNYFAVERSFETFRWSKNRFFHLDFYP